MTTDNKSTDGLPKKKILLILAGIMVAVLCVIGGVFWHSTAAIADEQSSEESYLTTQEATLTKQDLRAVEGVASTQQTQLSQNETHEQSAIVQEKARILQERLSSPLMLVNANNAEKEDLTAQKRVDDEANPNTLFMQNVSSRENKPVTAATIGDLSTLIAQGNFIHAILEAAINSDLPGSLRAIVSEPVYSEDGSRVLIPEGSRLLGEYKSGMQQGQSRIFIVWSRLITPQGISLQLNSSGVDSLGVAGMGADDINRHFWERFGTASLLSLIGAGTASGGNNVENAASAYRAAIAGSFSQSASQTLQEDGNIAPTLTTRQGKPIMVFIAKDLQFASAIKIIKPSINIF